MTAKYGSERTVPIPDELAEVLAQHLEQPRRTEWLFAGAEEAGPTPISRTPSQWSGRPRKGVSMQTFSQEFKDQIVELHRKGGRTFMDLAKEFNLSATTVSNWVRAADKRQAQQQRAKDADALAGPGGESDKAKITRLEKELARSQEELEILGKALAFFARRADQ